MNSVPSTETGFPRWKIIIWHKHLKEMANENGTPLTSLQRQNKRKKTLLWLGINDASIEVIIVT